MDWESTSAPTTHLEVVTIYRPTRVVAAVCCFIVTLMMIISICPVDWVDTAPSMQADRLFREGLFRVCPVSNLEGVKLEESQRVCSNQPRDFMKAVAAMIIIGWMLTLTSACLIAYGMISKVEDIKLLLYRIALILMMISGVVLLVALIVFPVMVSKSLNQTSDLTEWSLGWAYMLDWASLIIIVFVIVLLVIDPNPDETSVREKVVRS